MAFLQTLRDRCRRWTTRTETEWRAFRSFPRDVSYRLYTTADEAECIGLYRSLEAGFPPNGIDQLLTTLRRPVNQFIVAERAGRIVGMGGIALSGKNTATMYYGLVDPSHQGLGIGTALTLLRLCSLPSEEGTPTVFIFTLQKPRSFYQRLGFRHGFEWDDEEGNKHPAACLDLVGFRPDFVLRILRERNVVLETDFKPQPAVRSWIDKILLPDGTYEFRCIQEENVTPMEVS